MKKTFLPYEEAQKFVKNLNLKNYKEWEKYNKSREKHKNIPSTPHKVYKNDGWISYGEWLGSGKISTKEKSKHFISYKKAQKFVKNLNLKNYDKWRKYCKSGKIPNNIPVKPDRVYKNKGWISWRDFLGTKIEFLPYEKAQKFVSKFKFKNVNEWVEYCKSEKIPNNIPVKPQRVYNNKGWICFNKWFGKIELNNFEKSKQFLSYKKAHKYIIDLQIKSCNEWREYCKSSNKPENIPAGPAIVYKNKGWISWRDFLGTKKVAISYEELKKLLSKNKVKNKKQYFEFIKNYLNG